MKPVRPKIEALIRLPVALFCVAAMVGVFVSAYVTGRINDALRGE